MTSVLQTQSGRVVAKCHTAYELLGERKCWFFSLCLYFSHSTENMLGCLQVFYSLHIEQRLVKEQSWQSREVLIFVYLVYNPISFFKKISICGYVI